MEEWEKLQLESYPGPWGCGCYPGRHRTKCKNSDHQRKAYKELRALHYGEKLAEESSEEKDE